MNIQDKFYKRKLSTQGMYIYEKLEEQIISGAYSKYSMNITQPEKALDDGVEAYKAFRLDKPQYFFLSRVVQASLRGYTLTLTIRPIYTPEEILRINRVLEFELNKITSDLRHLGQWEREVSIYSRIARYYKYADSGEEHEHNIVGLTVFKKGVCEAFSSLLVLALRKVGIPAIKVTGYGKNEFHSWCMAWIQGIPYHLDVTWDLVEGNEEVGYFYFNLTDDEIRLDHVICTKGLPICRNPRYGYYYHNCVMYENNKDAGLEVFNKLRQGKSVIYAKAKGDSIEREVMKAIRYTFRGRYICKWSETQNAVVIYKET